MSLQYTLSSINNSGIWKRPVRVWGHRLTPITFDRLLNLYLHRMRLMGTGDRKLFEQHIRPGMRVLDIGANQGLYSLFFASLCGPQGHVIAFEPDDALFECLRQNCLVNRASNIELHHVALGASAGEATLFKSVFNSGDNRLAPDEHAEWFQPVKIAVRPVDDIVGDDPIDFIKIDVQGWEFQVFSGMTRTLRMNQKLKIYFEYSPDQLRNAGSSPIDLLKLLQAQSFALHTTETPGELAPLTDLEGFSQGMPRHGYTNLLAVRGDPAN